jgi:hypothetical protein
MLGVAMLGHDLAGGRHAYRCVIARPRLDLAQGVHGGRY